MYKSILVAVVVVLVFSVTQCLFKVEVFEFVDSTGNSCIYKKGEDTYLRYYSKDGSIITVDLTKAQKNNLIWLMER